ncbi:E3 ubiquitin-protein ligase TRAIP [Galendromus occidentalis]|uniref:E3 ubiquitin-protein ligase TRAIP n=1 Tax=Galendromus occidentalis TaxID=34638 RepID=A0AAJ7PAQ6_9ACAR|nr:E3 ubiquitin-protein ligase TRAIP [Galendromus occidentalis]
MRCQCIICTDDFDHSADIACLPCGHTFHQSCLDQWLKNSFTCPTCRCRVKVRDVRRVFLTSLDSTICDASQLGKDLSETTVKNLELRQKIAELEEKHRKLKALFEKSETSATTAKSKYHAAAKKVESLQGTVKLMKSTLEENVTLKETITKLQDTIEKSRHMKQVLNGTEKDVEDLLKLYGPSSASVRQIAIYCVSLKRELELAKNEVRHSRDVINSASRRRINLENELSSTNKELADATAEATKYREQCFKLTERLENLPERQGSSGSSGMRRCSGEAEADPEKRVKRTKSFVPSPPVLKARTNSTKIHGEAVKISMTKALPGYTKMKITPALRKPENPSRTTTDDELVLKLMKNKLRTTDKDSIQRKGYNGLGGHSSHIQTSKR